MGYATSAGLIKKLKTGITKCVQEFEFESSLPDVRKQPNVYTQFLPPKKRQSELTPDTADFPHVIVKYVDERTVVRDRYGINVVRIQIIAGTISDNHEEGILDVLSICTRIRNELFKQKTFSAYELVEEGCSITIPEEQLAPEWLGYISAEFTTPKVIDEGVSDLL